MRRLVVALGATFVLLLGSGLYQAFRYTPSAAGDRSLLEDATEIVHRWGAYVFCALVVATIVVWVMRERGSTRTALLAVVLLATLVLATIAEVITGRGLRWSQLALGAVVPDGVAGVFDLPDPVKFVLVGGDEVSPSEFSGRVWLHLVVFPIGLVLVGVVLWYLSTRNARQREDAEATT